MNTAETEDANAVNELIAEFHRSRDAIAMEVMQEVYARLPYDQEFTLSDGSKCKLKKFVSPCISQKEGHPYEGRPEFGFDVVIEGNKLDHLEFYCFNTGGGGMVG